MSVISDSLGDTLTRIRNGQISNKKLVKVYFSTLNINVLAVLQQEGYIRHFQEKEERKGVRYISVELKYFNSKPVIHKITRVSKPGRRIYSKVDELNLVCNGLGISILSTSQGVMSDHNARKNNVGGEVLCNVL